MVDTKIKDPNQQLTYYVNRIKTSYDQNIQLD
jgi:hypothetical protein